MDPQRQRYATAPQALGLRETFTRKEDCQTYLARTVTDLRAKGWITASLDSVQVDSLSATAWLFAGDRYQWASVKEPIGAERLLQETGWNPSAWKGKPVDMVRFTAWQEKVAYRGVSSGASSGLRTAVPAG